MANSNRSKKIVTLFMLIILGFIIFLSVMLYTSIKNRHLPSKYTSESTKAQRGHIISQDGFHVASTQKLYKATVNTLNIDPNKKDLFVELFSIYSGVDQKSIRKKLNSRKGSVVLSYHINPKNAQYLKTLAFELRRLKVFIEYHNRYGRAILHGLNIVESGETREYPYGKVLTPLIGYPRKMEVNGYTRIHGIKGIEKQYEDELNPIQNGSQRAPRDVNSYMILNKKSFTKREINGLDVKLNIPLTLQVRVEKMLKQMKEELNAKEVLAVVMQANNGKVISLASSNQFFPKAIRRSDYPSLNTNPIEYSFEVGSVLKPITLSLLLELRKINPYDLVFCNNGRYKLGRKVITDEHKFDWLSAEDIIVHSSNIGISKLAQKLEGFEFHDGLTNYGLSKKSGVDLPYEKKGSLPSVRQLNAPIYKATCAYGYGMRGNLMQLVKAYNTFNNNGLAVTPQVAQHLIDELGTIIPLETDEPTQIISPATAQMMKKILVKTVNEGTGQKTRIKGLEIGGKTGTAHIAVKGRYVNQYNSSFIGFANDENNSYTIGVTVVKPKKVYFASQTAVPTFKKIVEILVNEKFLTPKPQPIEEDL
ncbi:MAG: penicillin-binding protein 2 [Campylobacterota bacterium]|nr:penicillin-binding protein 2 [Campylobacterota bacterium]